MFRLKLKTRRGKLDLGRTRAVWVRFRGYVRPHARSLIVALLGALGVIVMQIARPWPIKVIFDYVLSDSMASSWIGRALSQVSSGPTSALAWVCAAVLMFAVGDAFFSYLRDVLLAQVGQRVVGRIRQDLFAHLQTLSPGDLRRHHTGGLLLRLTGDIQMLRQMLVNALISAGQNALLIVAMIGAMFWLNPTLALLGILTVPVVIWASWRVSRQIRKAVTKQRERESVVASIAHDVLGAMPIVQAYNRERVEQKRFARQNRSSIRAGVKATRLESKLYRIVTFSSAVGVCAVLYVGVLSVLDGAMTPGDLLVFVAYLRALNKPMRKVAKLSGQMAKATACGQRVSELFAITPSVRDREGARPLDAAGAEITLDNVSFAYEDGTVALSDVNLTIGAGRRVAIVGHTGAGKSTLAKLLLRFYDPQSGRLLIGGVDIRDATLESLRRQIGWVHQDTVLFGMTIEENITLGRCDASLAAVRAVAGRVQAEEFIQALPDGYETVLGPSGLTLSGGQRQRLALARALLRESPILILDEPASGLDEKTRGLVEQAWLSPENQATTLVICHRLQDMDRFDHIVVLANGKVCESGRHAELVAADGEYAALVRAGRDDARERIAEDAAC